MLLGISQDSLYFQNEKPKKISDVHNPYFLAIVPQEKSAEKKRKELIERWNLNKNNHEKLSKIIDFGEIEEYRSFCDFEQKRNVFKVFTKESYFVPEVSDYLFFEHGVFTAEHDIPYQQRSLTDIAAQDMGWIFDSKGQKKDLKVLIYDIETTQFSEGKSDIPIDIIGYSDFKIKFESKKDLETEEFSFEIIDCPSDFENIEIKQLVSPNIDEEIKNITEFCRVAKKYDIISGHNITGFDNIQLYNRIKLLLKEHHSKISNEEKKELHYFVNNYCKSDKSFHFGTGTDVVQMYPSNFDTFLAARKFYPFLNEYGLKFLAPFLGIDIKDRVYLSPSEIKLDKRTMKYNKQDIQEQTGVTINLIQQALPLAFTTCMPFDMLLPSGAVNMWDHMSMIRSSKHKKIMPPICRVKSITQNLTKYFRDCNTKSEIVSKAKKQKDMLAKDVLRVIKYGNEMPNWVECPYVVFNENPKDSDDTISYHMPGGMTIKPDKDANSHFVPWYYVLVADVGAMYPTILKALNIGADTVKLACKNEKPDEWIWLKKMPKQFFNEIDVNWREVESADSYADKGYMIGVKIDRKPGVVNLSMTGIMNMISKIKQELKESKNKNDKSEINRLKMMYQSMKGARNAGSVDYGQQVILVSPDGYLINKPIGEFVDSFIQKGCRIENINGTQFEISEIDENWQAISVNKNGKAEIKKIKQVVRHKWSKKLIKITTKSGFTVVTPNHSVFTIKDGGMQEINVAEINEKTLLAHVEKIPSIEKKHDINLCKEANSTDFFAFIEKNDLIHFNSRLKNKLMNIKLKDSVLLPYIKVPLDKLKNIQFKDDLYDYITVGSNGRKSSRIKSKISIDERLAELIGYYISEGHTSRKVVNGHSSYYITFSNSQKEMHERIRKLSNEILGAPVYTINRLEDAHTYVSTLHAKIVDYLFDSILSCGSSSRCKQIPWQILSSKEPVRRAFFDAYMKGDGNIKFSMPSSVPHGRFTTNSQSLNADLITLQKQWGVKTNTYFRQYDQTYNTRMIGYYKGNKQSCNDCYAIPPKHIEYVDPSSEYVYDLSIEGNENFIDANGGIILHNTHGILSAPTVTGRQFNLWGAAAITTKGQIILADALDYLKKKSIRVVYGDTDGIYLGCSKSAGNVTEISKSLSLNIEINEDKWITKPEIALNAIEDCNKKWQKDLNYPDFELEPEKHDSMIFVKHKNYLIFDSKNGKLEMNTKGNNFKGSDKANIARKVLKEIMIKVIKENTSWDDEEEARKSVKNAIMEKTKEVLEKLDLSTVDIEDLTLIQSVQPARRYKLNQDGSPSTFAKRAMALEKVIGRQIKSRAKLKFVVTKRPLPGITNPSKSGVKPIDYMCPIDYLKSTNEIDLDWYKKMIENYIQGAFGLSVEMPTQQTGLDAWM